MVRHWLCCFRLDDQFSVSNMSSYAESTWRLRARSWSDSGLKVGQDILNRQQADNRSTIRYREVTDVSACHTVDRLPEGEILIQRDDCRTHDQPNRCLLWIPSSGRAFAHDIGFGPNPDVLIILFDEECTDGFIAHLLRRLLKTGIRPNGDQPICHELADGCHRSPC